MAGHSRLVRLEQALVTRRRSAVLHEESHDPGPATPTRLHWIGLGCSPFARRYLGNHKLFSLPPGTEMFQFPGFAADGYVFTGGWQVVPARVVPFGDLRISAC